MATNRQPIVNLGLYLYATTTYSYGSYMLAACLRVASPWRVLLILQLFRVRIS